MVQFQRNIQKFMDTLWHIQLFGGLKARLGPRVLTRFRTQKAGALLAHLALPPHRIFPREELIDLLWPDCDLHSGRLNLRVALSSLRRQLEPPDIPAGSVLIADRTNIRLNPAAVATDVAAFEAALQVARRSASTAERMTHLAAALAFYRGELLPALYDERVLIEREHLALAYEQADNEYQELQSALPAPVTASATPLPAGTFALVPPSDSVGLSASVRLPVQFTRFFGRDEELAQIAVILSRLDSRLLTLTGSGGTGKTRLACEAGRHAAERGVDLVCFAALADLTDPSLVPQAIADALGLPPGGAAEPLALLTAALAPVPASLLILDNVEQFAEEMAPLVLALLSRLPALHILLTSRQRLFVAGERELCVGPLAVPPEAEPALEALSRLPSAALFTDRAQAALPDFQVTARNAAAVAALCRRLEGIPLALELTASWASSLTPAQMLTSLKERPALPARRTKGIATRHQTLWAAIGWSYGLLPVELARFWARLSVFRSGCTAEAAQEVCEEPEALSLLSQLRSRSLIVCEAGQSGMRCRMLETLREFAGARLTGPEQAALAERHTAYFLRMALESEPKLRGAEQDECRMQMEADHDNLRAVLDRTERHAPETALRLASSLSSFWEFQGHLQEGRRRLAAALSCASEAASAVRSKALHSSGVLAYWQADYGAARACYEEALELRRVSGEKIEMLRTLQNLASIHATQGEHATAEALYRESLALCEELGDGPASVFTLLGLAIITQWQGEWAQSKLWYEQALEIVQAAGDRRSQALALFNLGGLLRGLGDVSAAALMEQSLALARELEDRGGIARALTSLGSIAIGRNDLGLARTLLDEALTLNREIGDADGIANVQVGFGDAACGDCDWQAAQALYADSLAVHYGLGDERRTTAGLERLGILAGYLSCFERSALLLGAVQARRDSHSHRMSPAAEAEWDQALSLLRRSLPPAEFDAAFAAGHALSADAAVTLALASPW